MYGDPFDFDEDDWPDYPDEGIEPDSAPLCACGRHADHEACGCCGAPLCGMCFETGAGFCAGMPCVTEERLDAMHKALYGDEDGHDASQ